MLRSPTHGARPQQGQAAPWAADGPMQRAGRVARWHATVSASRSMRGRRQARRTALYRTVPRFAKLCRSDASTVLVRYARDLVGANDRLRLDVNEGPNVLVIAPSGAVQCVGFTSCMSGKTLPHANRRPSTRLPPITAFRLYVNIYYSLIHNKSILLPIFCWAWFLL